MIALSVIAAVVAMCAVAVSLWQAREAKNAQEAARRAQEEAQAARKAVEQATGSALQAKTAAEESRKAVEESRNAVEEARKAAEEARNVVGQAQEAAAAARMLADEAQLNAQQAVVHVGQLMEVLAAERRKIGMPNFAITPGAPDEFYLSYLGGPAVIEQLTVSVVPGSRVLGLSKDDEPPAEHLDLGPLPNGAAVTFRAATGQRASAVFQIRADPWEPVVVRADQ